MNATFYRLQVFILNGASDPFFSFFLKKLMMMIIIMGKNAQKGARRGRLRRMLLWNCVDID